MTSWVIYKHGGHAHSILPSAQKGEICELSREHLTGPERDKIAQVIVAAPQLLRLVSNITSPSDSQAVEKLLSFFNARFPLLTRRTRVLVCGGRDFLDRDLVAATLGSYINTKLDVIIHGAARGADLLAGEWAEEHDVPVAEFPADWKLHGKAAGPIRNRLMLDQLRPSTDDFVIAFPGGSGTDNMVSIAKAAGFNVVEVGK